MPRRSPTLLIPLVLLQAFTVFAGQAARPHAGKLLSPPNLSSTASDLVVGMGLDSIPGIPLSASVETENVSTYDDGSTVVLSYKQQVFRDGHGRTRVEQNLNAVGALPNPELITINIYDPAHKTIVDLFPAAKTALKILPEPLKSHRQQPCPAPLELPRSAKSSPQGQLELRLEELAPDFVDGLRLRHGRQTVKFPAHFLGNESAYSIITDFWYSQKWQVFVRVKRTGPGKTSHTVTLRDLLRGEPDPSLFLIPDGYQIKVSEPADCRLGRL